MARIRTVKPSLWTDGKVASLSRDARLTLIGLISFADDAGRFIASPAAIAGFVFPHDDVNVKAVKQWRDEIAQTGIIRLYTEGRCEYGTFPNWKRHQRISKPQPSLLPAPRGSVE